MDPIRTFPESFSPVSHAVLLCLAVSCAAVSLSRCPAVGEESSSVAEITRESRQVAGWTVHIDNRLLKQHPQAAQKALLLLKKQLDEIVRKLPPAAVAKLRKVPLYFSPEYPGSGARAEFHPGAGWLKENGRDPVMAKAVEFSNILIFEAEMIRMPNFALHELAHAYHDLVLEGGFGNAEITRAYETAKASGRYQNVERWNGIEGRNTRETAYAMTNPMEYFAETTEARFVRNDFFPFNAAELKAHDPEMFELLDKLWGTSKP